MRTGLVFAMLCLFTCSFAQTWVDTLDSYAREKYLPASSYKWMWTNAALLNTMMKQYEWAPAEQKPVYLAYVKKSMDRTMPIANGNTPNAVASAMGLAFLYRVTKDETYKAKAEKVYNDYMKIRRTKEGAVSHLMLFTELWDDTIFMIGQFLLEMYKATGDEKYLDEFMKQVRLHREKLQDPASGLWVHGWDSKKWGHCMFCSQVGWANRQSGTSAEAWGRGNGWIVVTLSDALDVLPAKGTHKIQAAQYLNEMLKNLPALQNATTGHWFQLPLHNTDMDNWIESSCTAMFAYGIETALRHGLLSGQQWADCAQRAYTGLRQYSITPVGTKYLTTKNVCRATCIGSRRYYYNRKSQNGKPYAIGMFIQFGRRYERMVGESYGKK